MVTLRQMRYFDALAITRHFGKAAEMVSVSQPALSAQIAEMERLLDLKLVERHPLGSQAFYPLSSSPWLVIAAEDEAGTPVRLRAFQPGPGQGVNIAMNTWHGVLTPLQAASDFLVIDRGGEGNNLEEHHFDEPWTVIR